MPPTDFSALCATVSGFGGIALIIWVSVQAKIALLREKTKAQHQPTSVAQEGAMMNELKAMRQEMAEMHSTGHEFNISFDEALNRLAGRVERLETKSAAGVATAPTETTLRNGNSSIP